MVTGRLVSLTFRHGDGLQKEGRKDKEVQYYEQHVFFFMAQNAQELLQQNYSDNQAMVFKGNYW